MKKIFLFSFCLLFIISNALAQLSGQQKREIEEKQIHQLEPTQTAPIVGTKSGLLSKLSLKYNMLFDYGGWLSIYYFNVDNSDNDKNTLDTVKDLMLYDFRYWAKIINKDNKYSAYLRLRSNWTDRNINSNYVGKEDEANSLFVEMFYLKFNTGKNKYSKDNITLGRQYFKTGRGIAYSGIDDGVSFLYDIKDFRLNGFYARTEAHPKTEHSDENFPSARAIRNFYGGEIDYFGFAGKKLYIYYVDESDKSKEVPENTTQDYKYDAKYYGLGFEGQIVDNTKFWAEYILERGKSSPDTPAGVTDKIDAKAFNAGAQYFTSFRKNKISLFAEYLYGSGDNDRASVTSADAGNTHNTKDKAFKYFGWISTGYAFAPDLANITVYKAGANIKPAISKDLNFTLTGYKYQKNKLNGAVSSPQAIRTDKDLGSEIDLAINYRMYSDLSFQFQFGLFKPGDAFPVQLGDRIQYINLSGSVEF